MRVGDGTRVLAAALCLAAISACAARTDTGTHVSGSPSALGVGVTVYPVGQRPSIPDVSGTTLDGSSLALSSLRGHVVVVNVWASWCGPCRDESPLLGKVATATSSSGVRFVGIDEQDRADAASSFAASAGTTYPHVVDADGRILASLRLVPSSGIPSTLVLDRSGAVAARVIGPVDASTFQRLVVTIVDGASSSP